MEPPYKKFENVLIGHRGGRNIKTAATLIFGSP